MAGALEKALGVRPKELVHVNLDAKLTEAGLAAHFPSELWPPTAAVGLARPSISSIRALPCAQVRELATKLRNLTKTGETKTFVFADLKKYKVVCGMQPCLDKHSCSARFLPPFYPEHLPVSLTDTAAAEETKVCLVS